MEGIARALAVSGHGEHVRDVERREQRARLLALVRVRVRVRGRGRGRGRGRVRVRFRVRVKVNPNPNPKPLTPNLHGVLRLVRGAWLAAPAHQ